MRTFLVIIFALLVSVLIGKGLDFSLVGAWWAGRVAVLNPTPEGNLVEEIKKRNEDLLAAGPREELRQLRKRQGTRPLSPVEMERVIQLEREAEAARGTAEKWAGVSKGLESVRDIFTDSIPPQTQANLRSLRQIGWAGGDANNGKTSVSWFSIANVDVADDTLIIRYPWREGVLRGSLELFTYKGEWLQTNGSGKFELKFNSDYSRADGWWSGSKEPRRRWFFALK